MGLRLTDRQRFDWLRLIRSERVGPRTFRSLLNRFGNAANALDALPDLARQSGRLMVQVASAADVEREMDHARRMGVSFVATGEPDYPSILAGIDDAPPLIAIRGNPAVLGKPAVAIVGSRNASSAGRKLTEMLARDLGSAGYAVVSGLARGIDMHAHKASLSAGTIAVLAGGHRRIYPAENAPLLDEILEAGAAITEMPLDWEPRSRDFPRRNRIVSGLSLGTVVVEAARRSGSLITARFALEQNREVFAVPGSPLDPRAQGTNDLLKDGAAICTDADDVLAMLRPMAGAAPSLPRPRRTPETREPTNPYWDEFDLDVSGPFEPGLAEMSLSFDRTIDEDDEMITKAAPRGSGDADPVARLLDLLGPSPVAIDDLVRQADLPPRAVQAALIDLELAGQIERQSGGQIVRR